MNPYLLEGKHTEEEKKSPYWAGRRTQEERDSRIKMYIDEYRVLTVELLMGVLDMPPTPSSRRIVETRLQKLKRYIRKIREGYVTYYVSPSVIKKGDPQLAHKLMESRFWIAAERALTIDTKTTSDEFRKQGGVLIPDGFLRVGNHGFFVEIDTGFENLAELTSKAERYYRDRDYLLSRHTIQSFQVLFVTRPPGRVPHIIKKIQGIGSGGMFLSTTEQAFQPFDASLLQPIWQSPKDEQFHSIGE